MKKLWGAHAPSHADFGALAEIPFREKFVLARRNDQHPRRVRYPKQTRKLFATTRDWHTQNF